MAQKHFMSDQLWSFDERRTQSLSVMPTKNSIKKGTFFLDNLLYQLYILILLFYFSCQIKTKQWHPHHHSSLNLWRWFVWIGKLSGRNCFSHTWHLAWHSSPSTRFQLPVCLLQGTSENCKTIWNCLRNYTIFYKNKP